MSTQIVCPKCGKKFDKPKMDLKRFGIGWSPPGMGVIKCPYCGYKAKRSDFPAADDAED